jgi:hypothetical protein
VKNRASSFSPVEIVRAQGSIDEVAGYLGETYVVIARVSTKSFKCFDDPAVR